MSRSGSQHATVRRHRPMPAGLGLACAAAVLGVGLLTAYVLRSPDTSSAQTVGSLCILLAAAVASLSCSLAARRTRGDRLAWGLLALGAGWWTVSQTVWTAYGVRHGHGDPFAAVVAVGCLAAGIPLAAGLLAFRRPNQRDTRLIAVVLDVAVIALSVIFVSWNTVLRSLVIDNHGDDWFSKGIELASPAMDAFLIALVLVLGMRRAAGERGQWLTLGLGLVVLAVTGSVSVTEIHHGATAVTGSLLATGWASAWLLVALAPWVPAAPSGNDALRSVTLAIALVPYLPVFVAVLILAKVEMVAHPFQVAVASLLLAAVAARQLMVILSSVDFTRHLEEQVSTRTRELDDARREALAASRQKSEFLTMMSHEIRTPMNGVLGLAGLLLHSELDDRQRHQAQGVQNAGEALMTIINEILNFSKIEAGKLELETIEFNLVHVVEEAAELVAGSAQRKGVELLVYCSPEVPLGLRGDPSRLRQVILNLTSNAVKFTEHGEVVVSAHLVDRSATVVQIRFEVTDTGIGIAETDRDQLFEPFSQADTSTTRRFGGTGLGLAICRHLVTAMGGTLGVDSQVGRGSTFWFTLPFDLAPGSSSEQPGGSDGLSGARVLVVDDNHTNRLILGEQLGAWGMRVDVAEGGEPALHRLAGAASSGDPYALAVVDMCMPGMNGLELATRIRGNETFLGTVLVLLTSDQDLSSDEAGHAGFSAQLTKPIQLSLLRRVLHEATGSAARGEGAVPRVQARPVPGSRGQILVVEDNPVNQLVAVGMLEHLGYTAEVAANGVEALAAFARTPFAAVLMDCQMPEMDGYEATKQRRAQEAAGRRTPIIAMTAAVTVSERNRCLAAGMDEFLPKPVDLKALESTLCRWVAPSGADAAEPLDPPASRDPVTLDDSRLEMLRTLRPGDTSLLDRTVTSFLSSSGTTLERIRDAVESRSASSLGEAAHKLRGSASNLGVPRVAAVCGELELLGDSGNLDPAADALTRLGDELALALAALRELRCDSATDRT